MSFSNNILHHGVSKLPVCQLSCFPLWEGAYRDSIFLVSLRYYFMYGVLWCPVVRLADL
jgi:hypothetical protein